MTYILAPIIAAAFAFGLYAFPHRIWVGLKTGTIKGKMGDSAAREREPFWFWFYVTIYAAFTIVGYALVGVAGRTFLGL